MTENNEARLILLGYSEKEIQDIGEYICCWPDIKEMKRIAHYRQESLFFIEDGTPIQLDLRLDRINVYVDKNKNLIKIERG